MNHVYNRRVDLLVIRQSGGTVARLPEQQQGVQTITFCRTGQLRFHTTGIYVNTSRVCEMAVSVWLHLGVTWLTPPGHAGIECWPSEKHCPAFRSGRNRLG